MTVRWNGDKRSDGVYVTINPGGGYRVVHPDTTKAVIFSCPCCASVIATKYGAKLIADKVYPPLRLQQVVETKQEG